MNLRITSHYYRLPLVLLLCSLFSVNGIAQDDSGSDLTGSENCAAPPPSKIKSGGYGCLLGATLGSFIFPGLGTAAGCALLGGGAVAWNAMSDTCEIQEADVE